MQSLLTLTFVVFVAIAGSALGDDECSPTPGQKRVRPGECCSMPGLAKSTMRTAADKCKQKYPMTRPSGPPLSGPPTGPPPTPSPEMKLAHACVGECIFTEEGLLTADKKLDKAAVTTYFTQTDATLAPVVTAAIEKCFSSYEADVDLSLECKSGAEEFQRCLKKETFLNCPSSMWTASPECVDFKNKVTKCPMMPFMMGGGGPRGPRP